MKAVTQQTYDQIAPYFAEYNGQIPENVRQDLQKFLGYVRCDGLYLDLGCGAGRDLAWFASQQVKVYGADFSLGMLTETRKLVACPLAQMDMRSLGFADETFDGIWCNAALLHLPKQEAPGALQEMRRILRAGGMLGLAVQQGSGEGLEVNPYTNAGERFFARYSMDEITSMLVANGFVVLETGVFDAPHRTWLRLIARVER